MSHDRVTIFSNGMADFRRSFTCRKGRTTEVSIPLKREHVGDLLASFNVYGRVALTTPPTFSPANDLEGKLTLRPEEVLEDLAIKLSGATVCIDRPGGSVEGTLVGYETEEEGTEGEPVTAKYLVVLAEDGLSRIALRDLQRLRFTDPAVRREIDKALVRNVRRLQPDTTLVTVAIDTDEDEAEATVQYTIPAAAWKITYRLRETDDGTEFQGLAVIDNNTDEDWKDVVVSVVTGEPITFSTDLADAKVPRRRHVNIVRETALGAVEVQDAVAFEERDAPAVVAGAADLAVDLLGGDDPGVGDRQDLALEMTAAATEAAEVRDVGDSCIFESRSPVSIEANRSAVVPVFSATLNEARGVLHYRFQNHPERPYRAVLFKNETPYSLGRGVCTVYNHGAYTGNCIMPTTKPRGECMLPHALETGVRLQRELEEPEMQTVGFKLSDGCCHTSRHVAMATVYRIRNSQQERLDLFLDHDDRMSGAAVECTIQERGRHVAIDVKERLPHGCRLSLTLEPEQELIVRVVEGRVVESEVALVESQGDIKITWLYENLVQTNGPLANDPGIRKCVELQQALDRKREEISDTVKQAQHLAQRQERLRQNISAGGQDDQTSEWRHQLGEAEKQIMELEERETTLRREDRAIRDDLRQALKTLSVEWKAA